MNQPVRQIQLDLYFLRDEAKILLKSAKFGLLTSSLIRPPYLIVIGDSKRAVASKIK